ncbi:MAG: NAD(+)/NADH kinase [Kiritimatiellia bacterium]|jgi:NAD+ kinase|nr:NAD(+)/NADH kinase [Pseudomonadales bacterium]MDP6809521.1 NAD(+)/NADH kinase [Kiritimatiellia bacterium]MDP7022663.1 NAD(+)/NADH kinase [Kiritimatiellia bacterium]
MKTLGLIVNMRKPRARDVVDQIASKACKLGQTLIAEAEVAALREDVEAVDRETLVGRADAIVACGGDGTMLSAARILDGDDTPVMGVNIGSLGFLTSIAEEGLDHALESLAAGDMDVRHWSIADAVVLSRGSEVGYYRALNDVVLRGGTSRVVTLDLSVGGDHVTSYMCDGLIVSTPAGSTGYSLAAGGPILTPSVGAFVISLICPHTLSSRPLVVPDNSEILITVGDTGGGLFLTADGQVGQSMEQGDCVKIRRSEKDVRFVQIPGHSYFAVLREKLTWSGSTRHA